MFKVHYPTNFLRNVALTFDTGCKYVFLNDVDFVPDSNMENILSGYLNKPEMINAAQVSLKNVVNVNIVNINFGNPNIVNVNVTLLMLTLLMLTLLMSMLCMYNRFTSYDRSMIYNLSLNLNCLTIRSLFTYLCISYLHIYNLP